jgi:hypothetical protein
MVRGLVWIKAARADARRDQSMGKGKGMTRGARRGFSATMRVVTAALSESRRSTLP